MKKYRPRVEVIVMKPDGSVYAGRGMSRNVNFPGGGIDGDESPAAAGIRELREETGIVAVNPRTLASVVFREWGDEERAFNKARGRDYVGSETHYILADYASMDNAAQLENWRATERGWYKPSELLKWPKPTAERTVRRSPGRTNNLAARIGEFGNGGGSNGDGSVHYNSQVPVAVELGKAAGQCARQSVTLQVTRAASGSEQQKQAFNLAKVLRWGSSLPRSLAPANRDSAGFLFNKFVQGAKNVPTQAMAAAHKHPGATATAIGAASTLPAAAWLLTQGANSPAPAAVTASNSASAIPSVPVSGVTSPDPTSAGTASASFGGLSPSHLGLLAGVLGLGGAGALAAGGRNKKKPEVEKAASLGSAAKSLAMGIGGLGTAAAGVYGANQYGKSLFNTADLKPSSIPVTDKSPELLQDNKGMWGTPESLGHLRNEVQFLRQQNNVADTGVLPTTDSQFDLSKYVGDKFNAVTQWAKSNPQAATLIGAGAVGIPMLGYMAAGSGGSQDEEQAASERREQLLLQLLQQRQSQPGGSFGSTMGGVPGSRSAFFF